MARTSTPKPHPLTPSPRRGEGERKEKSSRSSPLSTLGRGGQGVRTAFTRKLLAWWARAARDLPWRKTRDPYRVLVSEFMLQQTQVSRVAEYYPRFIERFPDLATLAKAKPRAVREAWAGLLRASFESPCVGEERCRETRCRERRCREGRCRRRRCHVAG